jgi:3-oxoadipate enol-lactonase
MSTTFLNVRRSGAGRPLLLLHPVGLDGTFWSGVSEPLSRRCRVLAVDAAGHGASPDARRPGRMDERVADVIDLILKEDFGPAVLVGVSFGGMIAQNVALARPDLVAGLVLAGCPGRIPAEAREAILARGSDAERGGMAAVVEPTLERWFTPGSMSTDAVARVRQRLLDDTPSNWAAAWEAIAEHDALERLGAYRGGALVIAGERDLATPLPAKQALAAAIPGARLVVLPGAPHMMQIEQPSAFLAAIEEFLDMTERARS